MTKRCIEIVTYHVHNAEEADRHRAAARRLAEALPGFGGWLPLSGGEALTARADIVVWESHEAAKAAAEIVAAGPDFAEFRASIRDFGAMGHYGAPAGGVASIQAGEGVEIGRFRLRKGIDEDTMRRAHAAMIAGHLSHQRGWRGQRLIRLQDGSFIDLAFADTQTTAETICNSWAGQPDCDAFLALIEPESMEFGSVIG